MGFDPTNQVYTRYNKKEFKTHPPRLLSGFDPTKQFYAYPSDRHVGAPIGPANGLDHPILQLQILSECFHRTIDLTPSFQTPIYLLPD